MTSPGLPPAVFYIRNRTFLLSVSLPIAASTLTRIFANLRSGDAWLNWLAGLVLWLFLLFLAIRRRLVIANDWLEYTDALSPVRIPWEQVSRVASRKRLGIWTVEGLEVWTATPALKRTFIDLTQFGKSWRQTDLGKVLRAKVPHLFE